MIPRVTQRPRARFDLLQQFVYISEEANVVLAERYYAAVDRTCSMLVNHRMPAFSTIQESPS